MFSVAAAADAAADHSDGESLSLSNYMHSLMWPASERLMNSSACGFARSLTHSLTHFLKSIAWPGSLWLTLWPPCACHCPKRKTRLVFSLHWRFLALLLAIGHIDARDLLPSILFAYPNWFHHLSLPLSLSPTPHLVKHYLMFVYLQAFTLLDSLSKRLPLPLTELARERKQ